MESTVVVLSGGLDSTVCMFWAKRAGFAIHAVTFDYNQRHKLEIECSKKICEIVGVLSHEIVELGPILRGTSPLVSDAKLEEYSGVGELTTELDNTFVPMRNQLFLTIAANRAAVHGATSIVTGVRQGNGQCYPDCTEKFISSFEHTCNTGTFTGTAGSPMPLKMLTPLLFQTREDTIRMSLELQNCYESFAYTHTSYDGIYPPVSNDRASVDRANGFLQVGIPDPLVVRAWNEGLMDLPDTSNYAKFKMHNSLR